MTQTTIVLILTVLSVMGCEGPTGPIGLTGPIGPTGPLGPTGHVDVQAITFTLISTAFSNSSTVQVAVQPMPEITSDVVARGAVLAYTDIGTGQDLWLALPFTIITSSGNASTLSYLYSTGTFQTLILKNSGINFSIVYSGFRIRVVIIPPASATILSHIDKSSYKAVQETFGL